jgi:HlyD family secretion protein
MKKFFLLSGFFVVFSLIALLSYFHLHKGRQEGELTLYGNIDLRQVNLGFRVFGKLKSLHFEEGDVVHALDLLAELDEAPYLQNLEESRARIHAIKENLAYATDQLNRRASLVSGKSVSEEDYQRAYFSKKSLEANLKEAQASYEKALIALHDTRLMSPSEGIIYTRVREPGAILNVGEPIYSMALMAPMWARTYISEKDLGRIYPGMAADIYTDTADNPIYQGHIGFISPIAEFTPKNVETPDLRTNLVYQLRVIIAHPGKDLRQGMPVTIKLKGDKR